MKDQLTQSRLKELLHYDPETGVFTWKHGRQGRRSNAQVGSLRPDGYVRVLIDYRAYYAHRLAWLYMTGAWPDEQIDHRNGNPSDNRWANLRPVSHSENNHNIAEVPSHNTSGLLGASWNTRRATWYAQIQVNGRKFNLGYHPSAELAHAAYLKAKNELHPTHLRLRGAA